MNQFVIQRAKLSLRNPLCANNIELTHIPSKRTGNGKSSLKMPTSQYRSCVTPQRRLKSLDSRVVGYSETDRHSVASQTRDFFIDPSP